MGTEEEKAAVETPETGNESESKVSPESKEVTTTETEPVKETETEPVNENAVKEKELPAPVKTDTPVEMEVDAKLDDRARLSTPVMFEDYDATIDVISSHEGRVITSLSQDGFQHLLSGIRTNTGAKAGRYLFEVKILEYLRNVETELHVGFSLAKSSLFLGSGTDGIGFSYDGSFFAHTDKEQKRKVQGALGKGKNFGSRTVGVLLNLDESTPTANTVSVFLNGVRAGQPRPIPEHLLGKALYPTLTFKNVTLQVNVGTGGVQLAPLPFKCEMFANIASDDAECQNFVRPENGRYSVVIPVGLPEEGFFDYVDHFLEENPDYFELSKRMIKEWFVNSGLWNRKRWEEGKAEKSTIDDPSFHFGIGVVDNKSVLNFVLTNLVHFAKRNFIIPELHANLLTDKRTETLRRFAASHFDIRAHVVVGEPSQTHKDWVKSKIIADHTAKKQKAMEFKARKKAKDAASKASKDEDDEEPSLKKQKVEEAEDDALSLPEIGPDTWYRPKVRKEPDVAEHIVNNNYFNYSLPTEDSFKDVEFVWKSASEAEQYLAQWVADKKATTVIKDLKPSDWFAEKRKVWQDTLKEMQKKQKEFQATSKDNAAKQTDELLELTDDDNLHKTDENGATLYAHFKPEDWMLLSWRFELHLLAHGFVNDVNDSEHVGVPTMHIPHYYKLYFRQPFNPQELNCKNISEIVDLMSETLQIDSVAKRKPLSSKFEKDANIISFVKIVEEARRDRLRRIEAGDESARLKFTPKSGNRANRIGGKFGKGGRKGGRSGDKPAKAARVEGDGGDAVDSKAPNRDSHGKSRGKGKSKAGGKSSRVKMGFQQRSLLKSKNMQSRPFHQRTMSKRPKNVQRSQEGRNLDRKRPPPIGLNRAENQRSKGSGKSDDNSRRSGKADNQRSKGSGKADDYSRRGKGGKSGKSDSRPSMPPPRPPSVQDRHADRRQDREQPRHQERHQDRFERHHNRYQDRYPSREDRQTQRNQDRHQDRNPQERQKGSSKGGKGGSRPSSAAPSLPSSRSEGRPSSRDDRKNAYNSGRPSSGGGHGPSRHFSSFASSRGGSSFKGDRHDGKGDGFGKSDRGKGGHSRNFDRRR